jgi:micrococcal nuclease
VHAPRRCGAVLLALVLAVAVAACSEASIGSPGDALEANAVVTRVVDGDTIVVEADGVEERVRMIGFNTPESVKPGTPVMCFGKEASAHLGELLREGTPVQLVRDVEARDRYDRLLAYVYRAADGLFVNKAMIDDGYADQYTFPPNVAHVDEFGRAAAAARDGGVGLWSACEHPFEE